MQFRVLYSCSLPCPALKVSCPVSTCLLGQFISALDKSPFFEGPEGGLLQQGCSENVWEKVARIPMETVDSSDEGSRESVKTVLKWELGEERMGGVLRVRWDKDG